MVRATRSTQILTQDSPSTLNTQSPPVTRKTGAGKKRKRQSNENAENVMDVDKEQASDTERTEMKGGKEFRLHDKEHVKDKPTKKQKIKHEEPVVPPESKFRDAGDISIPPADTKNLLLVLQAIDTQALLDVSVPNVHLQQPSSSTTPRTSSIRTMLEDPSSHSIRSLQSAILSLEPSDIKPRVILSEDALKRRKFCEVALGLLDEIASKLRGSVDLNRSNLDPDVVESDPNSPQRDNKRQRFALYQHLPTGEYFTSAASLTPLQAGSLTKGQASIVSIAPSIPLDPSSLPTLGSYSRPLKPTTLTRPDSEKWAVGSFLDYGPFASFAPVYDSEASSVGRTALSTLVDKKKKALLQKSDDTVLSSSMEDAVEHVDEDPLEKPAEERTGTDLASFGVPEMDDEFIAALERFELGMGVDKLLENNARGLVRLVELQNQRFSLGKTASEAEVGGEEWKLAESLLQNLTTLTSLRPRLASDPSTPIVPPPHILRALHRTLLTSPSPGWKGTLARDGDIAYRDNSTIRPGTTPYVAPAPVNPPAPTRPAPVPNPIHSTPSYASAQPAYSSNQPGYAAYQQSQYTLPQQYPTSTATRPGTYYPSSYYGYTATTPAAQPSSSSAKPAPSQPYYYPYAYPGGMAPNVYPSQQQVGTPGASTQQRAIPNMARANSSVQNTWGTPVAAAPTATGGAGQTLPAHLRKAAPLALGSPSLPSPAPGAAPSYPPATPSYPMYGNTQGWPGKT